MLDLGPDDLCHAVALIARAARDPVPFESLRAAPTAAGWVSAVTPPGFQACVIHRPRRPDDRWTVICRRTLAPSSLSAEAVAEALARCPTSDAEVSVDEFGEASMRAGRIVVLTIVPATA